MALFVAMLPFFAYFYFVPVLPKILDVFSSERNTVVVSNKTSSSDLKTLQSIVPENLPEPLPNPPAIVKGVFVTGWSAGSKNYLAYLQSLLGATQINSVVIDIKDSSGFVSYSTGAKKAKEYKTYHPAIGDIDALIKNLHDQGIYIIGRIVVFQDSVLAKKRPDLAIYDTSKTEDAANPVLWQNNNGLHWVDPASKEVWDYNIEIAKDAFLHGFDEINFDYARFPTDGKESTMGFPAWNQETPKYVILRGFFQELRESLPGAKLSIDVFGQTTIATGDMGIGQVFEDTLPYFDYVCPMVYPSHYVNGFLGYQNPAEHPYEVVSDAMENAKARREVYKKTHPDIPAVANIRPWLQDFNMGAIYAAGMVRQEIQATMDAIGEDFNGYLLWNPSNVYSEGAVVLDGGTPK